MHEALGYGTVLVAILAGILLNRQDVHNLRGDLVELRRDMQAGDAQLRRDMQAGFDLLHKDLSGFSREMGVHDARLDALEAKAKEK